MPDSVTLAGYQIDFITAVCNVAGTEQTWIYQISVIGTPTPEISNWVLELCPDPRHQVIRFTVPDDSIVVETGTFTSCLSDPQTTPDFNGIKWENLSNDNVAGIYTFTLSGCFQQTDVDVAVQAGGTCTSGVITGPSCASEPPTTQPPTTQPPTTQPPTTQPPTTQPPTTQPPTTQPPRGIPFNRDNIIPL